MKTIVNFFSNIIFKLLIHLDDEKQTILKRKLDSSAKNTVYSFYRKKYEICEGFKFNGSHIIFYGDGIIKCGDNSYIGSNSTLQSAEGCMIRIGKNCSISHNVRMYTKSLDSRQNLENKTKKYIKGDIVIGNGVWIGANVVIAKGVRIGNNVVVGANSVVTKDIQDGVVCGGVPCRVIFNK